MAFTRIAIDGYGQVELNKVAFRRDGRIVAQASIDASVSANYIENGMLLTLNAPKKTVGYAAPNATHGLLLNYTTEHIYDERTPGLKNFKCEAGGILPRLGYIETGDVYTTNVVSYDDEEFAAESNLWEAVADASTNALYGVVDGKGAVAITSSSDNAVVQVVEGTTLPDRQAAIKFIVL